MTDLSSIAMPSYPAIELQGVLAHYVLFRHVQKAHERDWLSTSALFGCLRAMRERVNAHWESLFPGMRSFAVAWANDRLDLLRSARLVPEESLPLLRQRLQVSGGTTGGGMPSGGLPFMWRLHVLYGEMMDAVDRGEIPRAYQRRLTEMLHERALVGVGTVLRNHPGDPELLLQDVLAAARARVEELSGAGVFSADEARYLVAALSGPFPAPAGRAGALGNCLVCGSPIAPVQVTYCEACETPHHKECWEWSGACSMFACRSTRSSSRISPS